MKALDKMDLLSLPQSVEQIKICEKFSPERLNKAETSKLGGCDRFFWLRTRQRQEPECRHEFYSVFEPRNGDSDEFRLCNIVLQGGGALGLAHAGFITGLERAGIRFAGIAGTSAGAIVSMGLAAIRGDSLTRETHTKLTALTGAIPMGRFIDGPQPVRKLIKAVLRGEAPHWPRNWSATASAVTRLRDVRGLNRGHIFERWLEEVLGELGFHSINAMYAALDKIWNDLSQLRGNHAPKDKSLSRYAHRHPIMENGNGSLADHPTSHPGAALLQLITTAMPIGLKLNLPQHLCLLNQEYEQVSPARLVRTSMSIPGFFEPMVMRTDPVSWKQYVETNLTGLLSEGQIQHFSELTELSFLDGGMMSNLPSDSFRQLMPDVPTIVVPLLGGGKNRVITRRRRIKDLAGDAMACVTAIRLQRDREVWLQNGFLRAEFERLEAQRARQRLQRIYPVEIAGVDTGQANWLNFSMTPTEQADLFLAGLRGAATFLEGLDAR